MTEVLKRLRSAVAADGYVCLVIGDVRRGDRQLNLAEEVWKYAARPGRWHCHGLIADGLPSTRKVSRIWKGNRGRATKTDRILLLSPSSDVGLPPIEEIDWDARPQLQELTKKGEV
jgi:site-specific DNA-methyltransferase (adenine-specific)